MERKISLNLRRIYSQRFSNVVIPLLAIFVVAVAVRVAHGDVTDRGSYEKSISIAVPKFHEITPTISLLYDSSSGNGPLGRGWSLQVGSQISRTSIGQGVPQYDNSTDLLWLDGMELLP